MRRVPAGTKLPTLSLCQPWASLTANGRAYEKRNYSPGSKGLKVGETIATHATKYQKHPIGKDLHGKPFTQDVYDEIAEALHDRDWKQNVPRGKIVPTAVLAGAYQCGAEFITPSGVRMAKVVDRWGIYANIGEIRIDTVGDFSPGRWAWRITGAKPIHPLVEASGSNLVPWFWVIRAGLDANI